MLCKILYFLKLRKFHRETPVLKSLFNVAGLKVCKFIKMRLQYWCFPLNFATFLRSNYFEEYLITIASKLKENEFHLRRFLSSKFFFTPPFQYSSTQLFLNVNRKIKTFIDTDGLFQAKLLKKMCTRKYLSSS